MISTWETQGSAVCSTARDANLRLAGTTGEVLPTTRPESFLEFLYLKALDFGRYESWLLLHSVFDCVSCRVAD